MNPERWERVQEVVEQALERTDEARRAFVESACGTDAELRAEVLSLLAACERGPETQGPPTSWFDILAGPEPPRFSPGDHVAGRYRIERLLGRGGMGEVFEAWDAELGIPVALKTLHVSESTEQAHKRLKLEGLLARSVWHPNVCRLYDLGRDGAGEDATWFLTMELLQGETLAERLRQERALPLDDARRLAIGMAAGLAAAHQAGIVHRDFKPANILLVKRDGDEQAVVMDFGIARAAVGAAPGVRTNGAPPGSGPLVGTPAYMAPEQLRGEEAGPAADIFALGVVLYEMVTGARPWAHAGASSEDDSEASTLADARRRLKEVPRSPGSLRPELDDRWTAAILRCLEPEPRRRFMRAEDVMGALAGRGEGDPVEFEVRPAGSPGALPAERDAFLGREIECRDLEQLLAGARLVTLVGAGGMGKTRLAIHAAARILRAWPGGVWFCDLTEARSAEGVTAAVADAFGVQFGPGDLVAQLGHAIATRGRCLVILDNFEQVVGHARSTVGRWLERAAEARFLITSREKLGLGEVEQLLAVGPLPSESALELFTARARRLLPALELGGEEAEAAREIVRLVDGMPLAVELAAARMRVMSAARILARMQKRFTLLTGGTGARHETLAMAIDVSWELLSPWERSAWVQCSIFEGGFTLEAAENVVDLRAWPEAPWIVDVVQSLVDKSLLRKQSTTDRAGEGVPEARFGMLVSLAEYARLKLGESPAVATERMAEERHGHWYARLGTSEAIQQLRRRDNAKRAGALEREFDNLIAACRRALDRGDAATAVAVYSAAVMVLAWRGPFSLGVALGQEILTRLSLDRAQEARARRGLGLMQWLAGNVEESRAHAASALALAREVSDRSIESSALGSLGVIETHHGRLAEGAAHLEVALAIARELGDQVLETGTLNSLSITRRAQGRMEDSVACGQRALEVARALGDRQLEGNALNTLGIALHVQGRFDETRAHYEAAIAAYRETGFRRFEGNVNNNLGLLHYDQGRLSEAHAHLQAALRINRELGYRHSEGLVLTDLGSLYRSLGRNEEARAHFELAERIVRELGNRRLEGYLRGARGRFHDAQGDVTAARADYEAALVIHRELNDRRSEGGILAHLAGLLLREGSYGPAQEALAAGEPLLRQLNARCELGHLLCARAELEFASGTPSVACAALKEAEELAAWIGSGPDSDLGRRIVAVRGLAPSAPSSPA